jgi:hypothetical protein
MEPEPPHNEGDEDRDPEPRREPSWDKHPNWPAIVNLLTQLVVLAGTIADVLSHL